MSTVSITGKTKASAKDIVRKVSASLPKNSQGFDAVVAKLNAAQRQAVDTIEGPVMVVAGPGTGKTQVLAVRVANILKKTHARPSNILCLTFSVSGTTAMRERLRSLIGSDAYGVTVSTIHGFCDSIIEQYPQLFEQWAMRSCITDLQKYQQMNAIIDSLSAQSDLINPKDPYGKTGDLLSRISQVKREGKSMDDLAEAAHRYDQEMSGKSRVGTKAHAKNLLQAKKFRDFMEIYKRYQTMLQETGRYDYDDMILFVLKAFSDEDWLLQGLQEKYQYILVDESQDLSGAQWKVVEKLTSCDSLPNEPNLFVVGDDDQAIYRFQGANVQHLLGFKERFPKCPVIVLTENYRSTQAILDAAERLIEKNEERLVGKIQGLSKHLASVATLRDAPLCQSEERGSALPSVSKTTSGTPQGDNLILEPILLKSPSDTAEPWLIADLIADRLTAGIAPEEIAVLMQTNAELYPMYDVLRSRNIPVILHGKANLLEHPIVRQVIAILQAAAHPRNDGILASALACDCFGCHCVDLARISNIARERESAKLMDVLLDIPSMDIELVNSEALIAARDAILELHQKRDVRTVLETVERILTMCAAPQKGRSRVQEKIVETGSSPSGLRHQDPLNLAAIEAFFNFAKQQCLSRSNLSFADFLTEIELYANPDYGQVRLTYQLPHLVTFGVQLLTAHQSKGLEFHTVILSNFRDGHWDERRNHSLVSIPEDVLFGWHTSQKDFEKRQDERRVTYVAMTRAKRELIMTCPREVSVGERTRSVSPSAFFAEAGPLPERDAEIADPEHASLLLLKPTRELDAELDAYIRSRLENFALSPTSLNRFLRDPQEFLRVDILQQPEHFDESSMRALGYGSAVHWALKEWAVSMQEKREFGASQLVEAFDWYLAEKTILTEKQREDLSALANVTLSNYFKTRLDGRTHFIHAIERNYQTMLPGEIKIKGKIDRIDRADANSSLARVIDYKSSRGKTESEIRGGMDTGKISRSEHGDYFRQLAFYAVLLEKADPLLDPQSFVLDFLGERSEEPIVREFAVTQAEKDDLKKLIVEVWGKIQGLDFSSL